MNRDFLQLDVNHSGRTTHKIIVEVGKEWLAPARIDELKEVIHEAATRHDWTLEEREMGPLGLIPYKAKRDQVPVLTDTPPGLTIWEIVPT